MTDVPVNSAAHSAVSEAHLPQAGEHGHGHGLVAHHFDDAEQQHDAVELGMWTFLAQEVLFFGGLFLAYAVYRFRYQNTFAAVSEMLSVPLGTINTCVLLSSSFTMALAVYFAKHNQARKLALWLGLTLVFGTAFLGIKAVEWHHDYEEHLVPGQFFGFNFEPHLEEHPEIRAADPGAAEHAELFMVLYFSMTGLHAIHMIIGMVILAWVAIKAYRLKTSLKDSNFVEMMGLYWHFVDIVWIFLFPFLYLIRI